MSERKERTGSRGGRDSRTRGNKDKETTRNTGNQDGFHEKRKEQNKQEDRRKKAIEKARKKKREIKNGTQEKGMREENNTGQELDSQATQGKELGSDILDKHDKKGGKPEGVKGGKKGIEKAIGFNPFSYRSVKDNLVDDGVNSATKKALNSYMFGLGTAIEKVNGKITGQEKMDYAGKVPAKGKLILVLTAVVIVVMAWALLTLAFMIIAFGAVALLMDDDGSSSSSGDSNKKQEETTGSTSGKGKPMPPELLGKYLLPNTERVTSMAGKRNNPTGQPPVRRMHWGADMAHRQPGFSSLKIYPIAPGKIIKVTDLYQNGTGGGLGNVVVVDHGDGYTSVYGHFSPGILVKVGDQVGIDTALGIMGHTGNSTGFHLHLEMYEGGAQYAQVESHWIDSFTMLSCTDTKPMPYGKGMKTECYEYQKKVRGIK